MKRKNKYVGRSKISEAKFRAIVRYFSIDRDASQSAALSRLNRNTINRYLHGMRIRIAQVCENYSPLSGQVEIDASFFGARRVKGKRRCSTYGKTIVFGLLKRQKARCIPRSFQIALNPCYKRLFEVKWILSVIYSDGFASYDGLVDVGYDKHFRVDHGNNEFACSHRHSNGIEGFWGVAKTRLSKFRGISRATLYLYLKECEFRCNNRHQNLYDILLQCMRNNSLFSS